MLLKILFSIGKGKDYLFVLQKIYDFYAVYNKDMVLLLYDVCSCFLDSIRLKMWLGGENIQ